MNNPAQLNAVVLNDFPVMAKIWLILVAGSNVLWTRARGAVNSR
jgi:hypothetical protein